MGDTDHRGTYMLGPLQQELNRVVERESMMTVGSVWQTLRSTCAWTDDELVAHASMLGAEFKRPSGM